MNYNEQENLWNYGHCGLWITLFYVCRLVEPIEFIGRPSLLGLGATPKPMEPPPKKKNWIKKPGEVTKKVLRAVGGEGRGGRARGG